MRQKTIVKGKKLSDLVIKALRDKKGTDMVRLDLRGVDGAVADYFVLCTGTSDRHVKALADSVIDSIREEISEKPLNQEGLKLGEWILMDYVDVVVHVFLHDKREFYNIEGLWADGKREEFED